ncbi:MAG TPA: tetratricopeptide repeat protein [Pirellulaceae bacterium]|nr:tetratricopeptide repeat protein [Pirellulaceae bacterium]
MLTFIGGPASGQQKKDDAKPESSPEALALYTDAANFQNKKAYDLAVDEWASFLKKYPKDPLAPKAQHYLGVCQMQLKQFDAAAKSFDAVIKGHPQFELVEDAWLNLAWSQYSLASPDKPDGYSAAQASFAALLEKYPKGKYVDQGLFFSGECLYHLGKKADAAAKYEQVVKNHPKSPLRLDAAYVWGVALEEAGQFAAAGQAYDLYLKEFADQPLVTEVKMRKAETILQAGDFGAAEKLFAAVAATKDFSQVDHALSRQAFCLAKAEKFAEAGALYGRIATEFPKSTYAAESALAAGKWLYRAEQFPEATKWFEKVIAAKGAELPEAAHWQSRIQLRAKQPDAALKLVDQALAAPTTEKSPLLVNLKLDRADALYELADRRADSLAAYAEVAAKFPEHELAPQALYNVAFGQLELKKYDDGLKQSQEFLKKYASHKLAPDVKYVAAECQLQQGKHAEAEAALRELTGAAGEHPEVNAWRVRLALAIYLQKKYVDTIKFLAPVVATLKAPEQKAEAEHLIGASHFYQDQFAEALTHLSAAIAAAPKWRQADESLLLLSRTQRRLDKLADAKTTVQKALAEFPQSKLLDQLHYRLGEYSYAADDFAGATAEYDVVLTKFPESTFVPYARYGKGWCQLKTKEFAAAAETLGELLKKFPEHPLVAETTFARGMARRQAGDQAGSVADFDAFLKSNPPVEPKSNALFERGLAEVALKKYESAIATFSGILKDNAKYADADKVRYEMAWAYKSLERNEEAVVAFRELATAFPQSAYTGEAHFHIAEDLYDQKQFESAVKEYSAAKQRQLEAELAEKTLYKLGWSHFQLKQYQPALDQFTAQLAAHPQGPLATDTRFMQGECLFRLEKHAEALPALKAAGALEGLKPTIRTLALLHAGQSAGQLKQWADSDKILASLVEQFADSPYVAEAQYERGWAQQNLKQPDAAMKLYEDAATRSRDHVGARARFMMGELYFEKKEYDEAVKQFRRVMLAFDGDKATTEVKKWQAKSGYEAARCWDVQIQGQKDAAKRKQAIDEARKFYTYVVDSHPEDALVAEARKRLAALSKL